MLATNQGKKIQVTQFSRVTSLSIMEAGAGHYNSLSTLHRTSILQEEASTSPRNKPWLLLPLLLLAKARIFFLFLTYFSILF